uniref:Uncharacterized protein n=1 Tax=Wenzhou levi-like virus 4 TaxID=1923570 RepID=A0A1L3KIU0_9VIRU|nr:hypothetical protein [Wenzhou levi-like virus 4]
MLTIGVQMIETKRSESSVVVRDLQKGKVEFDTVVSAPNQSGISAKCKFKVAKPYRYHNADYIGPRSIHVKLPSGTLVNVPLPSSATVLSELESGSFESTLRPYMQSHILEAAQGASLNSQEYGDLLLGVTALEARETYSMVKNVFISLYNLLFDFYRDLKRGNIVGAADAVADAWLQWRYGWRPFIGELTTMHEMLTTDKLSGLKSSYGNSVYDLDGQEILIKTFVVEDEGTYFTYELSVYDIKRVVNKVGFLYLNTASSRNDSLLAQLGLDADSILSTAWDLVPFSFVIDFFFNIGNLLSDPSHSDRIDTFNHYVSTIIDHKFRVRCIGANIDGIKLVDGTPSESAISFWANKYPPYASLDLWTERTDLVLEATRNSMSTPVANWCSELGISAIQHLQSYIYDGSGYTLDDYFQHRTWSNGSHHWKLVHPVSGRPYDPYSRSFFGVIKSEILPLMGCFSTKDEGMAYLRSFICQIPVGALRAKAHESHEFFYKHMIRISDSNDDFVRWELRGDSSFSSIGTLSTYMERNYIFPYMPQDGGLPNYKVGMFSIRSVLEKELINFEPADRPEYSFAANSFCREIDNPGEYQGITINTELSSGQWADLAALGLKIARSRFG